MSSPVELAPGPLREDEELVAAVRRGDEAAFAEIHDRYRHQLEGYCTRLLSCADEAEDAVQQTFLKAHQSLQSNGNGIVLGPWLYTIARNESFTMLRTRQRRPVVPLETEAGPATPGAGELAEAREELRETLADIRSLPTEQREALVQTSLDSAAGEDVAAALGCEPAKVKSLVFRARSHLNDLREAREMSCHEVKEKISAGSGATLRQRVIREHLRRCESCSELAGRPRFRRKLAAPIVLWPLLSGKLGGFGGAVESAAASSGAAAASGVGAKALTAAVAVVAAAGGVAANHDSRADHGSQPPTQPPAASVQVPGPAPAAGASLGGAVTGAAVIGTQQPDVAIAGVAGLQRSVGAGPSLVGGSARGSRGVGGSLGGIPIAPGPVDTPQPGREPSADVPAYGPPSDGVGDDDASSDEPPAAEAERGAGHGNRNAYGHEGEGSKDWDDAKGDEAEPSVVVPVAPGNSRSKSRGSTSDDDGGEVPQQVATEPADAEPSSTKSRSKSSRYPSTPPEATETPTEVEESTPPPGWTKNGKAEEESEDAEDAEDSEESED